MISDIDKLRDEVRRLRFALGQIRVENANLRNAVKSMAAANWLNDCSVCLLDDGDLYRYDAMSSDANDKFPAEVYELLGHGAVFSVNGEIYEEKISGYFYRERIDIRANDLTAQ